MCCSYSYHLADVYLGRSSIQIPTSDVLADPVLWPRTMAAHRVSHSWAPNFGFRLVVAALREAGHPPLPQLSSVRALMNAGEQVTAEVVDAFLRLTGLDGRVMQPAFGMAETATCVTYCTDYGADRLQLRLTADGEATEDEAGGQARSFIDLGPPVPGVELRIVSPPRGDATPPTLEKPFARLSQPRLRVTLILFTMNS